MAKKILLAGGVGGLLMFIWGAIAHMALPLYESSVKNLPGEVTVVGVLKGAIPEAGFYYFPGLDQTLTGAAAEAAQKEWAEKIKTGPSGILVYRPSGGEAMSPRQLGTELLADIGAALIAAFLLSRAAGLAGFGARLLFVTLMGLVAWFSVNVSYWNWYGFPGAYTFAELVDQVGGFFAAGLSIAAWIKR